MLVLIDPDRSLWPIIVLLAVAVGLMFAPDCSAPRIGKKEGRDLVGSRPSVQLTSRKNTESLALGCVDGKLKRDAFAALARDRLQRDHWKSRQRIEHLFCLLCCLSSLVLFDELLKPILCDIRFSFRNECFYQAKR